MSLLIATYYCLTVFQTNCLLYLWNFLPPLLFSMSLSHDSRFSSEKEVLIIEKTFLAGFINRTTGNPEYIENCYSIYG